MSNLLIVLHWWIMASIATLCLDLTCFDIPLVYLIDLNDVGKSWIIKPKWKKKKQKISCNFMLRWDCSEIKRETQFSIGRGILNHRRISRINRTLFTDKILWLSARFGTEYVSFADLHSLYSSSKRAKETVILSQFLYHLQCCGYP